MITQDTERKRYEYQDEVVQLFFLNEPRAAGEQADGLENKYLYLAPLPDLPVAPNRHLFATCVR